MIAMIMQLELTVNYKQQTTEFTDLFHFRTELSEQTSGPLFVFPCQ